MQGSECSKVFVNYPYVAFQFNRLGGIMVGMNACLESGRLLV